MQQHWRKLRWSRLLRMWIGWRKSRRPRLAQRLLLRRQRPLLLSMRRKPLGSPPPKHRLCRSLRSSERLRMRTGRRRIQQPLRRKRRWNLQRKRHRPRRPQQRTKPPASVPPRLPGHFRH
uniref:Uncharacterized protein n=1 Tax=Zooxanthella nutricula TaxID=1333877 RepID=A0A7S2Q3X7_9DINO